MYCEIERSPFKKSLKHLQKLLPTSSTRFTLEPGPSGLSLTGSHGSTWIQLPVPGTIDGADLVELPPPTAAALARGRRRWCHLSREGGLLTIDGEPTSPHPVSIPRPARPTFHATSATELSAPDLHRALHEVVRSISRDDTRYGLNGVFLEVLPSPRRLRLVGSDGHRLHWSELFLADPLAPPARKLLPRAVAELLVSTLPRQDALTVSLAFSAEAVCVRAGGLHIQVPMQDGEFPNYRVLAQVKEPRWKLTLDVPQTIAALKTLHPLTRKTNTVGLRVADNTACFQADDGETQRAEFVPVKLDGDPLQTGFNPQYLLDVLNVARTDRVSLAMAGELDPCSIHVVGRPDCHFVVMPVRL